MLYRRGLMALIVAGTLCPILTGCATIVSKEHYPVEIVNSGGPTYFAVQDHKERVIEQGVTPQKVTLPARSWPFWPAKYDVSFAGNAGVQHQQLNAGWDPWVAGNLVLGSWPGLIVDGLTGAMYKLPKNLVGNVPPECAVADQHAGPSALASAGVPLSQQFAQGPPAQGNVPDNMIQQVGYEEEMYAPDQPPGPPTGDDPGTAEMPSGRVQLQP